MVVVTQGSGRPRGSAAGVGFAAQAELSDPAEVAEMGISTLLGYHEYSAQCSERTAMALPPRRSWGPAFLSRPHLHSTLTARLKKQGK